MNRVTKRAIEMLQAEITPALRQPLEHLVQVVGQLETTSAAWAAQNERLEALEGALEDLLELWDHYEQVVGDCDDAAIEQARGELEAEFEGARGVLQAKGGGQ